MARPLRVEWPGAVYHVTARGNERRNIFRADADRRSFLESLARLPGDFAVVVHGYCLMGNHYHLLLETPRGNLSRAMAWLQTAYTVRFNRRHERAGHLFQGRYKAHVVDADEYAMELLRYLHLNPVRIGVVKGEPLPPERAGELDKYRWSSHRAYAGLEPSPAWLETQWLRYFAKSRKVARRAYGRFVGMAFTEPVESPWEKVRGGISLGGEELWTRVKSLLGSRDNEEELRWTYREVDIEKTRQLVNAAVEKEPDQRLKVWLMVKSGAFSRREAARMFGYSDGSAATRIIERLQVRADQQLKDRMGRYEEEIMSCCKR